MKNYKVKSPLLFLIFNRPDTTIQVFNQIKIAQPAKLYIAADGPRPDRQNEAALCRETIAIVQAVDWPCEVKTLYRTRNLGCKEAVSTAIDWFFQNEEEGIILEDDCLPSNSFFNFCDTMLEKYRFDTRIRHITGCNLQHGNTWGEASYYFSNLTHVWGWAGWKRVWKDYDKHLTTYNKDDVAEKLSNVFQDRFILENWTRIFEEVKSGKIDTWDYQLTFINFFNNGLSIIPNRNLISNIGYGADATHTVDTNSKNAFIAVQEISEITAPLYILPEKDADYFTLSQDFDLEKRWRLHNLPRRRFKRWLREKLSR
ncbi:nucleotide-diphospho-sugar transferase [Pedobacter hartonius]|uniref:Nucleotide-diphospho-sugar transferase n=1 Tax=Pedobacter hartonius TaxID=425514 RepID=A0A1H3ZQ45_9SPHI|nr:nucleotide-diphospho-sugar transferase [Pedobacter hartonius]SEA25837.1 hypothetical protein SAMN05443550_102449 [Pedobacter hartonius]